MKNKTLALLALMLAPAATIAAPVHYDESVSGDLVWTSSLPTFALDVGLNTFRGTATFGGSQGTDWDGFAFTVAEATRLDSITYQLTDGVGDLINLTFRLGTGGLGLLGTTIDELSPWSPGTDSYTGILGPGTYHLSWSSATYRAPTASGDWLFSMNVSNTAVPAPGALLLVGLGLAGIGAARRKRKV